jgi:hypothetical protein
MTFLTSVRVRSQADVEGHVLQISVIPSSPWVIDKTSPISGSLHFFFRKMGMGQQGDLMEKPLTERMLS